MRSTTVLHQPVFAGSCFVYVIFVLGGNTTN